MADACIVCLGDLRALEEQPATSDTSEHRRSGVDGDDVPSAGGTTTISLRNTRLTAKSIDQDDEIIAHLLPCGHNLHNACLKPWVERANSCPICRSTFNTVELSTAVGGEVIDTYGVQDKTQEPVLDTNLIFGEDDLDLDTPEPCIICETIDESHEVMFCDGCDSTVHVFCAGFDEMPEVYHCTACSRSMVTDPSGQRAAGRLRSHPGQRRGRRGDAIWARVWQEVSRRLDLDLDFPFADDLAEQRTEEQQREFARWQRRFEVADRQGHARRLRNIASRLQPPQPVLRPAPESQEEIRAWNAFEKARESQDAPDAIRRKRRRSETPHSAHGSEQAEQRQLKRPRFRQHLQNNDNTPLAESSASAAQRAADEPTFLSSLLREVEQKPSASSPGASDAMNAHSPRNSSPVRSPISSGHNTPRALSATPPPQPLSPPLCSTIAPPTSPPGLTFSPFSPTHLQQLNGEAQHMRRGRLREKQNGITTNGERANSSSPNNVLSYSSKEEIQRMVKLVLKPRYRDGELNKDQYTDINRDVSRKLYDMVGDATHLADEDERAKWQGIAEEEVKTAIAALPSGSEATSE